MKRLLAAMTVFGFALGLLAVGNTALADNAIMGDFTAAYGAPPASCSTCHTSVPSLNPYGSALRANGFNFGAIEGLDSDGDGVSNLQEIRNRTNPGVPQAAPTTTAPSTTTTAPATTTTIATAPSVPGSTSTTSTTSTTVVSRPSTTTTTVTTGQPPAVDIAPPADAASGALPFNIGGVGTVWLAVEDGRLVIVEVDTTWTYSQETDGDEIEVEFHSGDTEVEFEAELEDGTIRTKVEFDDDDDDDKHRDDDDDDHDDGDDDGDDDDHRRRGGDDDDDDD